MRSKTFRKASSLYKRRKFGKVIHILEPQVFRYRESFQFFFLLGMSCLNTNDYGGAYSYLRRANDLKKEDVNTLAGLALIHLKRQENQEAIQNWFQIIDIDPKNKYAKRGLEVLKKLKTPEDHINFMESGRVSSLLPKPSLLGPAAGTALLAIILFFAVSGSGFLIYKTFFSTTIRRPEIAAVRIEPFEEIINENAESRFVFTRREIIDVFDTIREYFDKYRDNLAMREINRILLSNADSDLKEKVTLLSGYMTEPGFSTLKDNFSYADVIKEPELYRGCYVHWKGKLSNLVIGEKQISFDFLVGYDSGKILEGIVPVVLDFGARLNSDFPIEVLGKIVIADNKLMLEAVSVHQFQ